MTTLSILFRGGTGREAAAADADLEFFSDLNLDQIVASVAEGREEYDLTPFFRFPLSDVDEIAFRQEVMRDLQEPQLCESLCAFAGAMRGVRECLHNAHSLPYRGERDRWFADAATLYAEGVTDLEHALSRTPPASRGLAAFQGYLSEYTRSQRFALLAEQARAIAEELTAIRYALLVRGRRVEVHPPGPEKEFGNQTEFLFDRFRQGDVEPYRFRFSRSDSMTQLDSMIHGLVIKRFPGTFFQLQEFCAAHQDFVDPTISRFDREIQFYISWLDLTQRLRPAGLDFCLPDIQPNTKDVSGSASFDLALAIKLVGEGQEIVCNDFELAGSERVVVVTGPNQGGKTTFARAFGQMHYLARLGLSVPGAQARLLLCDGIFTHFERQEDIADLRGKLKDDLVRMHEILEGTTDRSILVVNEIFSSTAHQDAVLLSRALAERILQRGLICVWVTFIDELAALGDQAVSMVSEMAPDSPDERTYKIVRRPADGLAYARSVARKHGLTAEMIQDRLKP